MIRRVIKSVQYRIDLIANRYKYILNIGKIRENNPYILNSVDTINKIKEEGCSFSRFGDGEFYIMLGLDLSPF